MITVMIVDDSALVRQSLTKLLSNETDIEVIGAWGDPYLAADQLRDKLPQVLILDIEMPRMDGLTFLHKIMTQKPIPVIICSSLVTKGSDSLAKAIQFGAVDIIEKPKVGTRAYFEESRIRISDAVRAAAQANLARLKPLTLLNPGKKLSADAVLPVAKNILQETTEIVIAIGASTGGTEAIREVISGFPPDSPGVVIVQHMPENFTRSFAERLNDLSDVYVKEAEDGDSVLRGQVLIAPGNRHTLLKRSGHRYYVEVVEGPMVSRHRPSVDVLFRSVANSAGKNAIGVILTGMGDDGARGMLEMKSAGAFTIGQNEETSVVYGMPKEAQKIGAVELELPLEKISQEILRRSLIASKKTGEYK